MQELADHGISSANAHAARQAGAPAPGAAAASGDAGGLAAALEGLDVAAVVDAARGAPDGAARNAALRLLTAVACALPAQALHHVLEARP